MQILSTSFFILGIILMLVLIKALLVWIRGEESDYFELTDPLKEITSSALNSCPPSMKNKNLKLSGDKNHDGVSLGRIVGYTRMINNSKEAVKLNKDIINIICFKKDGGFFDVFPFSLLSQIHLIAFYENQLHSPLQGDVILNGVALEKISSIFWINEKDLDKKVILEGVEALTHYTAASDIIKHTGKLVRRGIETNAVFKIVDELKSDSLGERMDGKR